MENRHTYRTIITNLATLLLLAAATFTASSAQDPQQELARLRRDNIRLRNKVETLQKELDRRNSRMSSLDGEYDESGFFSLVDRWEEFNDDGIDNTKGLITLSKIDTILCIPQDDVLDKYIDIYTTVRGRNMTKILHRYDRYLPSIKKVFRKNGIPEEFAALAIVESAVNPRAVSHAGAVGMWQIMEDTARQYGMTVSFTTDDRYNVEKSTAVAAKILKNAYRRFGDWGQAVMSYNCGPGRMQTALERAGENPTYEDIYRNVPRETREYLPALVAAMYVNANRPLLLAGLEYE